MWEVYLIDEVNARLDGLLANAPDSHLRTGRAHSSSRLRRRELDDHDGVTVGLPAAQRPTERRHETLRSGVVAEHVATEPADPGGSGSSCKLAHQLESDTVVLPLIGDESGYLGCITLLCVAGIPNNGDDYLVVECDQGLTLTWCEIQQPIKQ